MMTSMLMLLLTVSASAGTTRQTVSDAPLVVNEIRSSGYSGPIYQSCGNDFCDISFDGSPVFTDRQAARAALLAELSALEDKMDSGTATVADVRRAIKLILKLVRISKETP